MEEISDFGFRIADCLMRGRMVDCGEEISDFGLGIVQCGEEWSIAGKKFWILDWGLSNAGKNGRLRGRMADCRFWISE